MVNTWFVIQHPPAVVLVERELMETVHSASPNPLLTLSNSRGRRTEAFGCAFACPSDRKTGERLPGARFRILHLTSAPDLRQTGPRRRAGWVRLLATAQLFLAPGWLHYSYVGTFEWVLNALTYGGRPDFVAKKRETLAGPEAFGSLAVT